MGNLNKNHMEEVITQLRSGLVNRPTHTEQRNLCTAFLHRQIFRYLYISWNKKKKKSEMTRHAVTAGKSIERMKTQTY